ncbi:MAG: hypothetical protein J0I18_01555, partial [Actinobacteria bacterium]|nr:hypothetical protein [Actinomycetota bacterium]
MTSPVPEPVARGVRSVRIPMPPGTGLPFSNAYLIDDVDGRVHVVDPGSPTAEAVAALEAAIGDA